MKSIYCIPIDLSIRLTEPYYLFSYKGTDYKLIPNKDSKWTDSLLVCRDKRSESELFGKASEFLSLVAFRYDAETTIYPGSFFDSKSLEDAHGWPNFKKELPFQESMKAIYLIPYIERNDQSEIVRIYRQANASNNIYLKFLFYWHTLVYPSSSDNAGVKWVNKICKEKMDDDELRLAKEALKSIHKGSYSIGDFLKYEVRDAIGHIKRQDNTKYHLLLDNVEQLRQIYQIVSFVKQLSRYRIRTEFDLEQYPNEKKFYFFHKPV